jgi:hypothetical protein
MARIVRRTTVVIGLSNSVMMLLVRVGFYLQK